MTSFWYQTDSSAQTGSVFFHTFAMGVMGATISFLRMSPGSENLGDFLHEIMKLAPTYPMASTIACDATCQLMAFEREHSKLSQGRPLNYSEWAFEHLPLDILLTILHALLWTYILYCLETGKFEKYCAPKLDTHTSD